MHFHLPKPLHSWREFAGEVGIIVIGVLIALGAEQVVEEAHWRGTIATERKALDHDVADKWNAMSARLLIQKCVDERLEELALVLERQKGGVPLGIVAPIGRPSVWSASNSALEMASADQSLSHMRTDQKQAYFDVQSSYQIFDHAAWEERASWRVFEGLSDPSVLDGDDWRELRRAFRDAVDSNRTMKFNLASNTPGEWLTPFKQFPRMSENKEALTVPVVQDLCRPAVKR